METEDPVAYVRKLLEKSQVEITAETRADGSVVVFAVADGLTQKFIFTPI